MKLCNSETVQQRYEYISHKCDLFNYCYMCFVFELVIN